MSRSSAPKAEQPMDPREHQRDVGEKEHFAPQSPQSPAGNDHQQEAVDHTRDKAKKNNTHRNEQTGHAMAEAERVRKQAERAA